MHLYASDADYHVRMHQAGIVAYTCGIPFYHYASGTLKSASAGERAAINRQADKDRDRFKSKWGCAVGSPEYYALFGHGAPDESR
jgi:GT2 family glycosyltransferase